MIKLKKKMPVLLMAAVIVPGLVISILGIYLVSQQKNARLPGIKKEFSNRLIRVRGTVETRARQMVETVFRQINENTVNPGDPEALLDITKTILLNNPIVKYPFFITSQKKFLFPLSKSTAFPPGKSPALEGKITGKRAKAFYIDGYNLEYRKRNFTGAVRLYLKCLEGSPGITIKAYIYNAVGRCYFKLNRFPQAIAYYRRTIDHYPGLPEKDNFLYFTALRQTAVSYNQMEATANALKFYLLLYEKILDYDYDAPGKSSFAFFKNEALDYLNRHTRENTRDMETERFSKAKEMDRLKEASRLDISLRWLYFEAAGEGDEKSEESRFLKLRELYESDDEKTRFYKALKGSERWKSGGSAAVEIMQLAYPGSGTVSAVGFKAIVNNHPQFERVFFGFMLSLDFIKKDIIPRAAGEQLSDPAIFTGVSVPGKPGLLSVPFRAIFPGKSLTLYSHRDDFFEAAVRRETRLYYILLSALIMTLALGTFLFYKYLAREAELVRLKADFVDRASHTLKTPLTRMSLLAENMARGWVTEEARKKEFFNTVVLETARMGEMIDNMLNFSRIEAGKQQYEPEETYLQEIAAVLVDQYSGYIKNLGFQFTVEIDDRLPPLRLDRKAVKSIMTNLLQNALKYSLEEKYIRIRVYREREQESAVFEIEDRGIGIAKKDIPYIFKKFSRITDRRVQSIEGSGLGLFLVRHALEAHNGHIKVESAAGKGSVFKVFFPFKNGRRGTKKHKGEKQ